ncbi:MAG: Holliday junction resolvase [Thermoplasmata archaeon]
MSGGTFERELKGILRGDEKVLRWVTRSCTVEEREDYWKIGERPFTVLRAAGSLGIDLVAIRDDVSFPIEVKASKKDTLWLSKSQRTKVQARELLEECSRSHVLPLYAYRLKNSRGDSWRVFTVDSIQVTGVLERIQRDLPKVKVSKGGHHILRWTEGWPLHRFIAYMADGM